MLCREVLGLATMVDATKALKAGVAGLIHGTL
jgi:hypothetical protein